MLFAQFIKDRRASVAPMLALAAIPLVGFVGASVDYSRASGVRASMQGALDSTALMLAKSAGNLTPAQVGQNATSYFQAVFTRPEAQNVEVMAAASSSANSTSVTVSATGSVATKLVSVMGFSTIAISASSTAYASSDGLGCVLALDGNASGAISGQGSTSVSLNGCSLYDNSSNATAMAVGGSARIAALSVGVVGGVSGSSNITTTEGIKTGLGAVADPYADVSFPAFFGCTQQNFTAKTTVTIDPGVYCGGMTLNANANATLNPGIYYLDGGSLSVNGGATMSGTGVTLVFTSKNRNSWATASINGNATINLTPPNSGPTAGIVIFGDRQIPAGTVFKFNGGASQYFAGAIYLPTAAVNFSGGAGTSTSCTQLIGDTVTFSGNSSFAINCSSYQTKPFSPLVVRLTS